MASVNVVHGLIDAYGRSYAAAILAHSHGVIVPVIAQGVYLSYVKEVVLPQPSRLKKLLGGPIRLSLIFKRYLKFMTHVDCI
ncbi:hypothetical protein VTO73DRAFT_9841 [Trametes versicolor]